MENKRRHFIVSVVTEDIEESLLDDLEGHIRGAVGQLLNLDAEIGFSVNETDKEIERICDICNKEITEGFCIGDGESYYCSEECLHKDMTHEEYQELYENDQAYWTIWED